MSITSDGSTASYYELPEGARELQDLISHRNMNAQDGEIFRAIYRKGLASHSDELRDAKKVLFYAQAEVKRLEKRAAAFLHYYTDDWAEWRPSVDDRAPRPSGMVAYITRSGNAYTADSALLDWTHRGSDLDIVKYRPTR